MKWYQTLYQFWLNNLERNVKRLSIAFGSLLVVIITTASLPTPLFLASIYGAGITFGTMVIMSIFGKNGNGNSEPEAPESETKTEIPDKLFGTAADNSIEAEIKEAVIKAEVIRKP